MWQSPLLPEPCLWWLKLPGHGMRLAIVHGDTIPNTIYIKLVNKPDVICPQDFHVDYIGYIGSVVKEKNVPNKNLSWK